MRIRYPTCNAHAPYYHLWPAPLYIFPHDLINHTNFGKKLSIIKCVFWVSLQLLSETFFYSKKNWATHYGLHPCILYSYPILIKLEFFDIFSKILKYQISWKSIQWEPSCSMRTDGRTERHDEANSSFSQFCESAYKVSFLYQHRMSYERVKRVTCLLHSLLSPQYTYFIQHSHQYSGQSWRKGSSSNSNVKDILCSPKRNTEWMSNGPLY
jgi:hypothetical protein